MEGKFIVVFHSDGVIWWHQSLTLGFLFRLTIGTFTLWGKNKNKNDVSDYSWATPNELELYANNLANVLHSFILGLFPKFVEDLKHLHESTEGLGKLGIHLLQWRG
jgi:hypothetical protein